VARARSIRELAPIALFFLFLVLLVAGLPWRCPLRALTGIPCPTCGMTRAARLALHGDFTAATRMHPLWFVVAPLLVAIGAQETRDFWRDGRWGSGLERPWVRIALLALAAALLSVWISRFAGAFGGPVRGD